MRFTRTTIVTALTVAALGGTGLVEGTGLASASTSLAPIGTVPASYTPWLLKSTPSQYVNKLQQCGDTMYAVGTISAIGQGSNTYSRGNGFSFSATTGAVTSWDPQVNGNVRGLALSPDCSIAYLGGTFTTVGGLPAANIAAVDAKTGQLIATFAHDANRQVDTLVLTDGKLLAGGGFTTINGATREHLASLNPTTGDPTPYANLSITGDYPPGTYTKIWNMQLSHAGDRLLAEGVFTSVGGQAREQVVMFDLGQDALTVDPWFAPELNRNCQLLNAFYVRTATWSPNDVSIYIATTGGRPLTGPGSKRWQTRTGLCDAAAAFPSAPHNVRHRWINYTGCDSYYSVAADGDSVYLGGHQRWTDNPFACDHAGEGSKVREGIAALNFRSGLTNDWDPERSRGFGADDMIITDAGLWVASDNFTDGLAQMCGGLTNKGGICFFPRVGATSASSAG